MREPTDTEADAAVEGAHTAYGRVLASWASDLLRLQARGERVPHWTPPRHQPQATVTRAEIASAIARIRMTRKRAA